MNQEIIINVKKLNKYFGELHAVKDLSLSVNKGEVFGFLGPNGSGKTTTIRMLCGLLTPDSGTGTCIGYDIIKESLEIKKHVGYMTQTFSYYKDMTVYENLDFISRVYQIENREKRIADIIEQFNFADRVHQLAFELSGGWKQRLALAACLLHDPQLLLLDEPTAGVDPKARRDFWDMIHLLSQRGITTLVSTHYMDEAERCTKLAYIAFGQLLVQGTIHEILEQVGLITFSVRGKNLYHLAEQLRKEKGIQQVVVFGEALHVSGKNADRLEKTLQSYKKDISYQWQKMPSNLEDVFIYLVGGTSEGHEYET